MSGLVEAKYVDGKLVVPSQDNADVLRQRGYGLPRKKKRGLTLSPYEALHLLEQGKARVIDFQSKKDLTFFDLLNIYRLMDPYLWTRYLIYKDLRDRGYTVKEGVGFGVDFQVYDRGKYGEEEAKYIVFGVGEGAPLLLDKLMEIQRKVRELGKELILAVIDRRSEIIYYSLSETVL